MFFWDYTYLLVIPPLILALYAQAKVRGTYAKYSRVGAASRISGAQMAKEILNLGGAGQVPVEETPGQMTDH